MSFSGFIKIKKFGSIFTTILGSSNSNLVVINGGPGLDHFYLLEPLQRLSKKRKLIFYDQLGCGNDHSNSNVTFESMLLQLRFLVSYLELEKKGFGIIAHSWGTYLALELLSTLKTSCIYELFLISPFPSTKERLLTSQQRLLSKIPDNVLKKVDVLAQSNNAKSWLNLLELISPYYTANPLKKYNFNFKSYNMMINTSVINSLGNFSKVEFQNLPEKSFIFQGKQDFIHQEDIKELIKNIPNYISLKDSGHYPFVEQKDIFLSQIDNLI